MTIWTFAGNLPDGRIRTFTVETKGCDVTAMREAAAKANLKCKNARLVSFKS